MARFEAVIRDDLGRVIPQATVTVFLANTQDLAVLYSDEGMTALLENPTIADQRGIVGFYVEQDTYDILIQRFDIKDRLVEDVEIVSAATAGPVGPVGGDLAGNLPTPTVDGITGIPVVGFPAAGQVLSYNSLLNQLQWGDGVPGPPGPGLTQIVLFAGQFMSTTADMGGFNNASRVSAAWRFAAAGEVSQCFASFQVPTDWVSEEVELSFYCSAGSLIGGGDFRILWQLAGTVGGGAGGITVPFLESEDNGATEVPIPLLFPQVDFPFFGIAFGRDPEHVDDTSPLAMNLEYAILRLKP